MKNCFKGAAYDILLIVCEKVTSQGSPKWSDLQYYHGNIAISTRCPKLSKWCQKIPKKLQNETLGLPKCSKVEPSGILRVAKVPPKSAKKRHLGKPWGAQGHQNGAQGCQNGAQGCQNNPQAPKIKVLGIKNGSKKMCNDWY